MFFPLCKKKKHVAEIKPPVKKVRFSKPKQEESSVSDSKRTLSATSLDKRFIELKLTYKKARRRIVVDEKLSYNKLVQLISDIFAVTGTFSVYYEDDEKDIIKVSSTVEVRAMLLLAMRHTGCTRLFIHKVEQQ